VTIVNRRGDAEDNEAYKRSAYAVASIDYHVRAALNAWVRRTEFDRVWIRRETAKQLRLYVVPVSPRGALCEAVAASLDVANGPFELTPPSGKQPRGARAVTWINGIFVWDLPRVSLGVGHHVDGAIEHVGVLLDAVCGMRDVVDAEEIRGAMRAVSQRAEAA
jgi:hypothetical protein